MGLINWEFLYNTFWVALSGVPVALLVTLISLLIAVPIGFFLALSRIYEVPVVNRLTRVYVSFVRGTPIIIQIFILYTSIPLLLNEIFTKYNLDYPIYDIHPIWYAFVIFSFNR